MNCFLLIFSRYSAFSPIAATDGAAGCSPPLGPISGRTQAHILLSPAWHALPLFKQLQSVSAYSAPIMFFCFLLPLLRLTLPGYVSGARRKHFGAAGSAHWLHICKSCPPAEPEACVSSGRAYYRPASQEALNALSPALFAPPPVNGVLPVACCILWVLNTILLRSKLTAKAFLLAPAQPRVVVSLKLANAGGRPLQPGPPASLYLKVPVGTEPL